AIALIGQHLRADACHQQTNTCHTPDALHAIPHCGLGLEHETGKASPGSGTSYQSQEVSSQVKTQAKEKGRPVGHPLRISSWRNAFGVGSPHAVVSTVCGLEAGSTLLGWRPRHA
ncbi:hypothetical protein, partial [Pseudomonas sp. 25 E 4]|uniref:hypothetical protein n=1 Tax=Pseudomonas sp. 25 E 4 TaxID=1844097 RepID=UPI001C3FF92A